MQLKITFRFVHFLAHLALERAHVGVVGVMTEQLRLPDKAAEETGSVRTGEYLGLRREHSPLSALFAGMCFDGVVRLDVVDQIDLLDELLVARRAGELAVVLMYLHVHAQAASVFHSARDNSRTMNATCGAALWLPNLHFAAVGALPPLLLLLLGVFVAAMGLELVQVEELKLTLGTALGRCEIVHRGVLHIQFLDRKCL